MKKTETNLERRAFLKFSIFGLALFATSRAMATSISGANFLKSGLADFVAANKLANPGNFHAIYDRKASKDQFFLFLKNVYNIYPEKEMHALIQGATDILSTDDQIYNKLFHEIADIKPLFSELSHALPALSRQKKEIAKQTLELLGDQKIIDGYLEIGTPGRYIGELKDALEIKGKVFLLDKNEPKYNPLDIVERGQLFKIAKFLPLNDYDPISSSMIESDSLDMVTNYIGFHHSPLDKLENFVMSINRILKKGGSLILRDHDVANEDMNHMVSLAHDVFNVGLKVKWSENHQEIRNFRTIKEWISYLEKRGFKYQQKVLFQDGDPTRNGLMRFVKA